MNSVGLIGLPLVHDAGILAHHIICNVQIKSIHEYLISHLFVLFSVFSSFESY